MPSKIDWLAGGDTVNFFTGCQNSCGFCYARRMAHRLAGIKGTVYDRVFWATSGSDPDTRIADGDGNPFAPAFHASVFEREMMRLEWARKPRRVFVGSMGDMCFEGEALALDWSGGDRITSDQVQAHTAHFAAEIADRGHTVLVLTKRPDLLAAGIMWPQNLHLGVSLTDNASHWRVVALLSRVRDDAMLRWGTRPGKLWASVEPLLDPDFDPDCLAGLDWVVVGFQTGPGTRPLYPIHAVQRIRDWCADRGVPLFCKDTVRRVLSRETWPREYPPITGEDA